MIEIAKAVPEADKAFYLETAIKLLKALDSKCGAWDQNEEALLVNGTSQFYLNNNKFDVTNGALIYGDYYFVEALCKLKNLQ